MTTVCHSLCQDIKEMEEKYGLARKQKYKWYKRWKGNHVYAEPTARYCSICCVFLRLVVGKGGIKSVDDAIRCPCCKGMLRIYPRDRKLRRKIRSKTTQTH